MKNLKYIPQIQPTIGDMELEYVTKVIKSTYVTEQKEVEKFEAWFSDNSQREAISYCNGTSALLSIGYILKMQRKKLIIAVPNMTFIASMSPFLMLESKIILVDIDLETGQFNPDQLEKLKGKINCLVVPVIYGAACDLNYVSQFCTENDITLIIDAAQAVGQKLGDKSIFHWGDYSMASFYGNKVITSAEGAIVISDKVNMQSLYRMKNHGRDTKGEFQHDYFGLNFAFDDLHAGLGNAQLSRLDEILKRKREIFDYYNDNIENKKITMFNQKEKNNSNHWFSSIFVDDAQKFETYMAGQKIGVRRAFGCLSEQPMIAESPYKEMVDIETFDLKFSKQFYREFASLPSSYDLTVNDLKRVVEAVNLY
jgi:perosamine synthetase